MKHIIFFLAVLQVVFAFMSLCFIEQPMIAFIGAVLGCAGILSCALILENLRVKEERGRHIKD